jgi:S-adenosylmethionine:tRNA ribosyltransferase-isomerase
MTDLSRASAYDYHLPEGRIAQEPVEPRDASRLLVVRRERSGPGGPGRSETGTRPADAAGSPFRHLVFRDVVDLIPAGDILVLNETRVFPARLRGRKPTGAPAEILLLRPASEDEREWHALVRPGGKLKPGRVVDIGLAGRGEEGQAESDPDRLRVRILDSIPGGGRLVRLESSLPPRAAVDRWGEMPLPPYIDRPATEADRERYQTVYARKAGGGGSEGGRDRIHAGRAGQAVSAGPADVGSVAAPTAGLHFTPRLLAALEAKGVRLARLVLHVGVGTFRPVDHEELSAHEMHSEWYEVPAAAASSINRCRETSGAVWAVGTTVVRTLETVADTEGRIEPGSGRTDLFLRPPYRFRAVDRLITNFHLPRSTLLMLVTAFGGYERVMEAYDVAVREGYRFYSYGDAMAIV